MAGYNKLIMIGNLTRDPEYKQLASGQGVCQFGIASNRQYRNKQTGIMVQEVCFIDVAVFGPQAESCKQYLQKGKAILLEGRIKFDTWESDGQKRSKHSVVADRVDFLSGVAKTDAEKEHGFDTDSVEYKEFGAAQMQEENPPKNRKKAVVTEGTMQQNSEESSTNEEFTFKDEPPFQDDLPF